MGRHVVATDPEPLRTFLRDNIGEKDYVAIIHVPV
jgi:hypothetical protein